MIYTTPRWREAQRMAKAITTLTGYQPSTFITDSGSYRVQTNNIGQEAGEAIEKLLFECGEWCNRLTWDMVENAASIRHYLYR